MIIYLRLPLPAASSDLPEAGGPRKRFVSVLLRMGFTCAPAVTSRAVVSYTAFPPLPGIILAVYFCCTGLGVTSTGRYPASCPVKPGLSSPDIHQPRLPVLLAVSIFYPTEIPLSSAEVLPLILSVPSGSVFFPHVSQIQSQIQPTIRQTAPPLRSHPTRNVVW